MSSTTEKSRAEILAERQEKKKRKAALKNQPKEKNQNPPKDKIENSVNKESKSVTNTSSKSETDSQPKTLSASESLTNALDKHSKKNKKISNDQSSKKLSNVNEEGKNEKVKKNEKEASAKPPTHGKGDLNNVGKTSENEVKGEVMSNVNNADKGEVKSKAQLKAERRAKQEAERARKLEKSQGTPQEKKAAPPPAKVIKSVKVIKPVQPSVELNHKVKLFAHLYHVLSEGDAVDSSQKIHPNVIQLGAQYASKVVIGANARCLALLNALKKVVMDFETPPNQEFSRGLEAEITKSMSYLSKCRPVAVSMVNAVKHLKFQVTQSKGNELECKNIINDWIDTYIREQLEMAAKAICLFVREKISSGDVILTYGCSSLIQQILISTHKEGINFQVVVVDGRPWLEGKEMLRKLVSAGISCTYVLVSGLSFIMPEVTKVLLGAHALLANGYVMSRAGSSQVALLAKAYNVPVLVCCETHKFSERVQTDSFVYNELGNPDDLVSNKACNSKELSKWKSIQYLTPLNLIYDVTPPDLVSAVVTEIAVLPCTSVPVILRIKPPDVSC